LFPLILLLRIEATVQKNVGRFLVKVVFPLILLLRIEATKYPGFAERMEWIKVAFPLILLLRIEATRWRERDRQI
jgi:hypothetical protein